MSSRAGNPKDGLSAFRARADNLLIGTLGVHLCCAWWRRR
jgi:hypothetical protein